MRTVNAGGDRGSVTAELAIGLSGVVMVLVALVAAVTLAQGQLRAVDAAAAGARAAARGEAESEVLGLTRRLAGPSAVADIRRHGSVMSVEVSVPIALPLPGSPRVTVRGAASTPAEHHLVEP